MPYLFAGLVVVNVVALGYFTFLYTPKPDPSAQEAQATLSKPIEFENNSAKAPPVIGTKK